MDSNSKSSSSSQTNSSVTSSNNKDEENRPLWKYVTKLEKIGDGEGNWKWICNFCGEKKQGTYTRVKAYLLKNTRQGIGVCQKVRVETIAKMRKMEDEVTNRISNSEPK